MVLGGTHCFVHESQERSLKEREWVNGRANKSILFYPVTVKWISLCPQYSMTSTCKLMLAREIWGVHDDKCEDWSSETWRQWVRWNLRTIRGCGFHLHSYSFHTSARNTWPPTLVEHRNKHRPTTHTINNNKKEHHSSREFVKYKISFDCRI